MRNHIHVEKTRLILGTEKLKKFKGVATRAKRVREAVRALKEIHNSDKCKFLGKPLAKVQW